MEYIKTDIHADQAGIELVTGVLYGLGFDKFEIIDSREQTEKILDDIGKYWDYADYDELFPEDRSSGVRIYLPNDGAGEEALASIRSAVDNIKNQDFGFDPGSLDVITEVVDDSEWADNWKQYFKPIYVGERLLILPDWEDMPEDAGDRAVVRLSSSAVFGTGQHSSTRLCLANAEKRLTPGSDIIDIGCGSGVLFMALLKLGARWAAAVDVDPISDGVVREHCMINDIPEGSYSLYIGDAVRDEKLRAKLLSRKYDMVLANIVFSVIADLIPTAYAMLDRGGKFIVSGIIEEKADELRGLLQAGGFAVDGVLEEDGWVSLACVRS